VRFVTLRLLCEGQTEERFALQVLKPHLNALHIFIKPEPLRKGNFGIVSWDKLRRAIQADVGRSREHEYVTTMVDLYRLGKYPGVEAKPGEHPRDRVARIESEMAEGLPTRKFIPYIQLHEFEALVLVDVEKIPAQFPDGEADQAPKELRESIGDTEPELIDDGNLTAPSKRIIMAVPTYSALKAIAGPAIAGSIGLSKLRASCPHFHDWLTKLEGLRAES